MNRRLTAPTSTRRPWPARESLDRLEQLERARASARGVRVTKLAGQDRYLARSRIYEPGSYFELSVSPWGHVRCTCPGFTYRGVCEHAEAMRNGLRA